MAIVDSLLNSCGIEKPLCRIFERVERGKEKKMPKEKKMGKKLKK